MKLTEHCGSTPRPPAFDCASSALFLDFDGTLVDIAPTPDGVHVPPDMGQMLTALETACDGALAIVSGRSLHELEAFLTGFDGIMIGSHGSQARGIAPPLQRDPDGMEALQDQLRAFAKDHDLLYEHKSHGGGVHFRHRPEMEPDVKAFVTQLAADHPAFTVQPAKMAFELRPDGFSKDGALRILQSHDAFDGRMPVYLGDDTTDEPALRYCEDNGGYGVKIGEGDSCARYHLPDPASVLSWLNTGLER
ncbi:trehalose-phosphatase [Thioclava sp. SK-1]|uniref:trehalose-phosphatase n=1 Tax=Thioclava sp. SK-1 TaxID=1889770 RepID=UPI00082524EA|nr:trehalose-phosphatase [Thioclava sp. SK-1]OCX61663.1 trehalose-phosphatase [Thioclava sp. SK-1]